MNYSQFRDLSVTQLARMGGFYLSVVAFVAILVLFVGEVLLFPFTAWFDPAAAGIHFIHDVTFLSLLLIAGGAMLVQLYQPAERVVAMQVALVIALFTLLTTLVSSGFDPMLAVFLGPVAVAAVLHPARRELIRFDAITAGTENRVLLGVVAVAVVPVTLYAAGELTLQATLTDEHAEFGHYSGMATFVLTFVTLAALAAVSGASHRLAAYLASILAVLLAAGSLFLPTVSAIDRTWSLLAVVWAIAVVAAFERATRGHDGSHGSSDEDDRDNELAGAVDREPVPR